MAFPDTMPTRWVPRAAFIPFVNMTPRQQAEHLVNAHEIDANCHGLGLPSDGTDSDLITWHEGLPARLRLEIHVDDEQYFAGETGSFAAEHTHDKEAPHVHH